MPTSEVSSSCRSHLRRRLLPALLLLSLAHTNCHAQQRWPLWEAYTKHFVDPQGRVIDRSAGDRTTSEGQAYAMFFALVDNDRKRFDSLLHWTQENLAGGDLTGHLPAWEWGKDEHGQWKTLDQNSASDADLWLAYSLIEAGRLWHEPRYDKLGRILAAHIGKVEVVQIPGFGTTLLPGPNGFHPEPGVYILNPSYAPLPVLELLRHEIPDGPWGRVAVSYPKLIDSNIAHGWAMDWISVDKDGMHPATPPAQATAGIRQAKPAGSFDAIRCYLWLGLADAQTPGLRQLLSQLSGMPAYLKTNAVPPLEVDVTGAAIKPDGTVGFSAAVNPFLRALGMKAATQAQADRVIAMKDTASGLYGRADDYYDQNLVLFSTGRGEKRYQFTSVGKLVTNWK